MFKSNDKTEKKTIRFTKEQVEFLDMITKKYGFNYSDYIRMLVNHQMFISKKKGE